MAFPGHSNAVREVVNEQIYRIDWAAHPARRCYMYLGNHLGTDCGSLFSGAGHMAWPAGIERVGSMAWQVGGLDMPGSESPLEGRMWLALIGK